MNSETTTTPKTPGLIILAALIIVIGGMIYADSLINQILLAFFLSIVSVQPIFWLQKKKVPLTLAVLLVISGIIAIFLGFTEIIGNSVSSFSENAPVYEKNLQQMSGSVIQFFNDKGIKLSTDKLTSIIAPGKVMGYTASALGQFGSVMGNMLTIFFLMIFLLLELDTFPIKFKAITQSTKMSLDYFNAIGNSIRHYLSIKTLTSLLTGLIIWIALAILGLDYAIIWALIAFLLNFIPNIGSIIAALPAVLFSLIQLGAGGALWTIIIFTSVNMLIGNVVEPKMMGKGLGLSTFVVFVALIFWGFILGTVGMFLSVPLTMAMKIILEQNQRTRWIAVILGTVDDANAVINEHSSVQKE